MLVKQIVHSAKLHARVRWFTRSCIIQETNKTDKISAQRNNENIKKTDGVLGKEFISYFLHKPINPWTADGVTARTMEVGSILIHSKISFIHIRLKFYNGF